MRCACARVARAAVNSPARYCRRASSDRSAPVTALLATSRSTSHLRRPFAPPSASTTKDSRDRARKLPAPGSWLNRARASRVLPCVTISSDELIREPLIGRRQLAGFFEPAHRLRQVALRTCDGGSGQRSPHVARLEHPRPRTGFLRALEFAEVDELLATEYLRDEIQRVEPGREGKMTQRRGRIGAPVVEIAEEAVARSIVRIRLDRALQQRQGFIQAELLGQQPTFHGERIRQVGAECQRAVDDWLGFRRHVFERRAIQ